MTTTGKTVSAIIIIIILIAIGLIYYLYPTKASDINTASETGQDLSFEQGEYANTLGSDSTALSRDQIQAESFDQTLASFEADLENESNSDYYDENSYVENSNTSGDLQLEY